MTDRLKAYGLKSDEIALVTKPIANLTVLELKQGIAIISKLDGIIAKENAKFKATKGMSRPNVINDTIDGVLNPATGKRYDSKAKYYADLKATGHMVVESGMHSDKREIRGDFDVRKELKQAAQQHGLI